MKRLLLALLLVSSACLAAITGPYPVGPGAAPLPSAVAVITRLDVVLQPTVYCIVTVAQFVSAKAMAAGVAAGQSSLDMDAADFQAYVLDPIVAGTNKDYQTGVESWLIAKKLPGWTKLGEQ